MDVIQYYKPVGLTPLEAIEKLKNEQPELQETPITYAGRLDPLAEGVLILLKGEAIKEKEKYLGLDKEYIAIILFGVETDSLDVLGIPKLTGNNLDISKADSIVAGMVGEVELPLPAYSSPPVQGKPLFQWAQEGRLGEIEIPKRKMQIASAEVLETKEITASELLKEVLEKIDLVHGDFRQEQIKEAWQQALGSSNEKFVTLKVVINCASGTYVRSVAAEIGRRLGTSATLLHLNRTRVGEFSNSHNSNS